MATLPREVVDAYTERLDALSEAARRVVAAQLAAIEYEDVADLREQVIAILEPVCAASSEAAAAYAAEFYDEVRAAQAGVPLGAEAVSAHLPEATEGAVRSIVQIVVDGKPWEQFARAVEDRADYEVKASAGECVKANAARDPLRPRWARVPDGSETCPFCIMLASRGFVYASEKTASEKEGGGHYHPNCDCRIVPGFDGMEVEGYDPDELYRRWKAAEGEKESRRSAAGVGFVSDSVKKRVASHELRTAKRLAEDHGMRPVFVQDFKWVVGEDGLKRKIGLPDLEDGTELKAILKSKNAYGALKNHLDSAEKKAGLKRVIVDNTDAKFVADSQLMDAARQLRSRYPDIPVLSILLKSGELVDL